MSIAETITMPRGNVFRRLLPGFFVTVLAIAALYFFVDLDELRYAFALADYRWLPLAIPPFLGTLAARTLAWRTILTERSGFKECFFVINQAYLLNNILPFRLGDLGRALMLSDRTRLSFWEVLSTVVVEHIFDLSIAVGLLLSTMPLVIGADWARSATTVAIAIVLLGFVVLFLMASNPKQAHKLVEKLSNRWPKLRHWLAEKVALFLKGLFVLRDVRLFLRVAFWMLLVWFFNVAWYYVLLRSFLPNAILLWALFSVAVASLGMALPSSPASVGVLETALVSALSLFGVDPSVALAYAVTAHVIYFVLTGIFGILGFWQQGQFIGSVYQRLLTRPDGKII